MEQMSVFPGLKGKVNQSVNALTKTLNTLNKQMRDTLIPVLNQMKNSFKNYIPPLKTTLLRLLVIFGKVTTVLGVLIGIIEVLIGKIDLSTYWASKNINTDVRELEARSKAFALHGLDPEFVKSTFALLREAIINPGARKPFVTAGVNITGSEQPSDIPRLFDTLIKNLGSGKLNSTIASNVLKDLGGDILNSGMLLQAQTFNEYAKFTKDILQKTRQPTEQQLSNVAKLNVAQQELLFTFQNTIKQFGISLIPALNQLVMQLQNWINSPDAEKAFNDFKDTLSGVASFLKEIIEDKTLRSAFSGFANSMFFLVRVIGTVANTIRLIISGLKIVHFSILSIFKEIPGFGRLLPDVDYKKALADSLNSSAGIQKAIGWDWGLPANFNNSSSSSTPTIASSGNGLYVVHHKKGGTSHTTIINNHNYGTGGLAERTAKNNNALDANSLAGIN